MALYAGARDMAEKAGRNLGEASVAAAQWLGTTWAERKPKSLIGWTVSPQPAVGRFVWS
jgi:hypothetical protein